MLCMYEKKRGDQNVSSIRNTNAFLLLNRYILFAYKDHIYFISNLDKKKEEKRINLSIKYDTLNRYTVEGLKRRSSPLFEMKSRGLYDSRCVTLIHSGERELFFISSGERGVCPHQLLRGTWRRRTLQAHSSRVYREKRMVSPKT